MLHCIENLKKMVPTLNHFFLLEFNGGPPFFCLNTPPKINIEHDGLEDDSPCPGVYSQVPCQSSGVYFIFKQVFFASNPAFSRCHWVS